MAANEKKTEIGELRALLRSLEIQRDTKSYEQVVQKVIAYMTLGVDVSPLFSEMIMASATSNIIQKKMVYLYLSNYAKRNSELALLTINTLRKDASDRDPTIRGLALRTMTSLKLPSIVEYIHKPIQDGLVDKSGYVRRTAVMGVLKIYYISPDIITDMNVINTLYQMINDQDPLVICNCLSALDEILATQGGITVTKKIAHYLISRLRDFTEWGQCQILQLLLRYACEDEDEALDLLNALDDRLQHVMVGVVMGTIKLFFHLTESFPSIQSAIFDRVKAPLITLLGSAPSEVSYICLQHIELLLTQSPSLFSQHHHNFYYRYNDPPYLKLKKIEVLTKVSDESNIQDIVTELGECSTDVNVLVGQMAIQAIGKIAIKLSSCAIMCIDKLLSLLTMEIDHITSEIIHTMTNILRKYENMHEHILPRLSSSYGVMSDPKGRASLIWILGEYGEYMDESPYVLEDIVNKIEEEKSSEVKLQLLAAVMKLFFKKPPECQQLLGRLLEYTIEEEMDMLIHDRGLLYYRLLKEDITVVKQIIGGSQKLLSSFTTHTHSSSLFREFNSLSVFYGKPSTEFIDQCPPYTFSFDGDVIDKRSVMDSDMMFTVDEGPQEESLLDIVSSSPPLHPPHILLNPSPIISATEFEQKWSSFEISMQESFPLKNFSKMKLIQEKLSQRFISMLACSPDNQPVMKMYLYAQHVSTFDIFLVEVEIYTVKKEMKVSIKTDNTKLVKQFILHFLETMNDFIEN